MHFSTVLHNCCLMFYVLFCRIFENNFPGDGVAARFFCPRVRGFAFCLKFPLLKNSPGQTRGWSGLELTDTSELLLPKVARCIPVLPSRYIGKCAARVLKRFGQMKSWPTPRQRVTHAHWILGSPRKKTCRNNAVCWNFWHKCHVNHS